MAEEGEAKVHLRRDGSIHRERRWVTWGEVMAYLGRGDGSLRRDGGSLELGGGSLVSDGS